MKRASSLLLTWLLPVLMLNGGQHDAGNINIGLGYTGIYNDNIFMNSTAVEDYASRLFADLGISINSFNLGLTAGADFYSDNPQFNSFHVSPSLEWFHPLKKRNGIMLSLSYDVLDYKEIYTDFNYNGPRFTAELKLYTQSQSIVKAGYSFEYRNYPNYESFDFSGHTFFLQWSRFFRSQTTLRLEGGFDYRHYPHIVKEFDFGSGYQYYHNMGNTGMGQSSGGGRNPGIGGHGGKPPWQGGNRETYYSVNLPNLYAELSVTQGLGQRAGLTAAAQIRKKLRGLEFEEFRVLIRNAYIIYPNNDDLLWDGYRLKLALKLILLTDIALRGEFAYAGKNYPGIYIMNDDGTISQPRTQRDDRQTRLRLMLEKPLGKFQLSCHLEYRDNRSNDDFFHYGMLTISAGLGYYF